MINVAINCGQSMKTIHEVPEIIIKVVVVRIKVKHWQNLDKVFVI